MSNRGNPDYFKIAGTATGAPDLATSARQHFTEERAAEAQHPHQPTGPESAPLHQSKKAHYKKRKTW